MTENKRYYWLKLQNDFFKQPRIKKLRKIAGGDTYTLIYLELQLLSLNNNGVLIFEGIEDDFIEELALTIDEDADNVKFTVMYLVNQGLIEEVNKDEFALIETKMNIGIESASTIRSRKCRTTEKTLQCNTDATPMQHLCNTNATKCNGEIELDIELDIEIDKEIDTKKDKRETYVSLVADYTNNQELIESLKDYIEMRKKQKGFTMKALKLNLNGLDKMACDDRTKIEIINQSVMNGWKAFYPLKNDNSNNHQQQTRSGFAF